MSRRPLLVFDGDCHFCRVWIERWRAATGDRVEYEPYQTAAARHPEVPRERFAEAVMLFEPGGRSTQGAEAAFRALGYAPGLSWLPAAYGLPGAAPVAEAVYRFVAARRPLFSRLTRLLWGDSPVPPPVDRAARLTLAGIGLCYLAAFLSLGVQVRGLVGADGILPAGPLLAAAKAQLGAWRFWALPSLAWLSASDFFLAGLCWVGAAASLGLVFGAAAAPCALACWALYLSLAAVGADFLSFQWDALLLEAGLIACFLVPMRGGRASRGALWLLRLLLAKLVLQSGLVKLLSGDPSWRDLTALTYHFWTQPLPTPPAWWAHRMPLWGHQAACAALLAVELGAPWLILLPRRARAAGAAAIAVLMSIIALTGNYGFFNLLTLALCLACLDDRFLGEAAAAPAPPRGRPWALAAFGALWLFVSAAQTAELLGLGLPRAARRLAAAVSPLRSINRYGLFAVMTKSRSEIVLEVSPDGRDWREWPFLYKPGDPRRAPPFIPGHMPRLDWQMWFAALGEAGESPWFGNLVFRSLQGSSSVTGLLGPSPIVGGLPAYARAVRYETSFSAREDGGAWWRRERRGLFFPVVSLKR